jgi:hypothetical protein
MESELLEVAVEVRAPSLHVVADRGAARGLGMVETGRDTGAMGASGASAARWRARRKRRRAT